jgi:ketosteroid isomerase-like protein
MTTSDTTLHPTRATILTYLERLHAGDIEGARATFQPDATWWLPGDLPISRTWVGRDAIIDEFIPTVMARFAQDTIAFETRSLLVEGERASLEWIVRARSIGGEDYENRYLAIFELRDGLIAAVREYMDTGVMARVLFPEAA